MRLSDDEGDARRVLDLVAQVPTPVWGRDELGTGEMWNSNSIIAWVVARSGIDTDSIQPPAGGRAPGWRAGLVVAHRPPVAAKREGRKVDAPLRPWTVSETDYPATAEAAEKLRFLLRYAVLAPSSHNTQPWLFRIDGQVVELRADRTRALPVVDPDDRALAISCGAALATLRFAARHFGHRTTTETMPDPEDEDLLARVSHEQGDPPSDDEDELFRAIPERRSNRQAFEDRELPGDLVGRLVADAREEGVWLEPILGDDRAAVGRLVAEGDRIQMADRRFRRELAARIHPNRSRSRDGMRGYGFGFGELMSHVGPLAIRSFDLGKGQAARDRELAEGSPLLAVFGTDPDEPATWLATGRRHRRGGEDLGFEEGRVAGRSEPPADGDLAGQDEFAEAALGANLAAAGDVAAPAVLSAGPARHPAGAPAGARTPRAGRAG